MKHSSSLDSYLGCPIIGSKVSKETFMPIVSKVQNQLPNGKLIPSLKLEDQRLYRLM